MPIAWLDATAPRSITVAPGGLGRRGSAELLGRRWPQRWRGRPRRSSQAWSPIQETPARPWPMDGPRRTRGLGGGRWRSSAGRGRRDPADARLRVRARAGGGPRGRSSRGGRRHCERGRGRRPAGRLAGRGGPALEAGDATGARDALDRALRLGRQQPESSSHAGGFMERVGRPGGGGRGLVAARSASLPSLAGDPWWSDPARAARWTGIRDAALAGMSAETAADLWLSRRATRARRRRPRRRSPTRRPVSGRSSPSRRGTATRQTARPWTPDAEDHPFDLVAVAWAGRVAARAGDLEAVADYRLWADHGQPARRVGGRRRDPGGDPGIRASRRPA